MTDHAIECTHDGSGERAIFELARTDLERLRFNAALLKREAAAMERDAEEIAAFLDIYRYFERRAEGDGAAPCAPGPGDLTDAYLVLENSSGARRVPVPPVPLSIGSDDGCDLVLPADGGVAPQHLLLWQANGEVMLRAVNGDHGVTVNDRPTTWAALDDGDRISLGAYTIRIALPEPAAHHHTAASA